MAKYKLYKALSLVALLVKNPPADAGDTDSTPGFSHWVRKIPWGRKW